MAQQALDPQKMRLLQIYQHAEITEHHIYTRLARTQKSSENRGVLERIAADELRHARYWRELTGHEARPNWLRVTFYCLLARVFGFTFAVKLMERGEDRAQHQYSALVQDIPGAEAIASEESAHEEALIALLDEERLRYTGSIVLGLNDALVELTGALAGFSLALQDTRLIAMTGAVTGIAAALSMAASEYLSTRTEKTEREPLKAAVYTGITYLATVVLLILPYLFLRHYGLCLAATLLIAIGIVALFNYYVAVAQDVPFRRRFLEMALLSLAVAAVSFGIGFLLRTLFGVEA
ncbi:MAG: VIT1/CCC1 transporter family protein [Chloroflexia bacterium]